MKKICLIAGNGNFPLLFSKSAKKKNITIICIAIKGETDSSIEQLVDKVYWLEITEFEKFFQILKNENIKKAVLVGKITKTNLFKNSKSVDQKLSWFMNLLPDRKDDSMLRGVAKILLLKGVRLVSSTLYMDEYLAKKGALTTSLPTKLEWEDIRFGKKMVKKVGALDIGQSVVIKNKAVMAVEAIEGTDEAILRAGELGGAGTVVVKMSKPYQDMRFDIPVIGSGTIESLKKAKARVLAIESKKTLIIDREAMIEKANHHNIAIVAI